MVLLSRGKPNEEGYLVGKQSLWVQVLQKRVNRSPTYVTVDKDTT